MRECNNDNKTKTIVGARTKRNKHDADKKLF